LQSTVLGKKEGELRNGAEPVREISEAKVVGEVGNGEHEKGVVCGRHHNKVRGDWPGTFDARNVKSILIIQAEFRGIIVSRGFIGNPWDIAKIGLDEGIDNGSSITIVVNEENTVTKSGRDSSSD